MVEAVIFDMDGVCLLYTSKPLPEGEKIGESWELSTLEQGPSRVSEGEFTGMRLGAVLTRFGKKAVGSEAAQKGVELPLLVKFLDAQGKLSVQVHPDEAAARALGSAAKTEAWYVVCLLYTSRCV